MRTIVLASRKGGVGKTTLSGHLAVEGELSGAGPVAIIDMDEQGSLSGWWNARKADTPAFARIGQGGLVQTLDNLRASGVRLVVIDTPPYATTEIAQVVRYADMVVVPVKPSPHDLRAVGETVDVIQDADKPFVFVLNEAPITGSTTLQAVRALSRHGHVAGIVRVRQDFRQSMIDGQTVQEIDSSSKSTEHARAEIRELWAEITNKHGAAYEPAA